MIFYEDIFKAFEKEKIDYVVVGGLAAVLHGLMRLTVDLDLIVALEKSNLEKFSEVMKKLGYRPKVPANPKDLGDPQIREQWINEKNMKVFSFYHDKDQSKLIDVFVTEPIPFEKLNKDKKIIKADHIHIPICSIEHLIELKKISGRPQDLADIKGLNRLRKK